MKGFKHIKTYWNIVLRMCLLENKENLQGTSECPFFSTFSGYLGRKIDNNDKQC
jgi:hypothetical protein